MANPLRGQDDAGYTVSSTLGGSGASGPFLLPNGPMSGSAVDIFVTGTLAPGASAGPVSLPAVSLPAPLPGSQSVFTAQVASSSPQGPSPYTALQITAAPTLVWSTRAADRASLLAAFQVLQAQLEALESVAGSPILKGSAELIANRVAAALALRYDELLRFFHGFDPVGQAIDIAPGMALQVAWAAYQYCDGPGGPNQGYNGFATTGHSLLEVVRRPDLTLAFDSYSGLFAPGLQLQPPNPAPPAGGPLQAAGPADLQLGGNARRHLKLLWPATFAAAAGTETPGATSLGCQLVGADTYADLAAAVSLVQAGQDGRITQSDGRQTVVIGFTGRVTVVPQVRVLVNGVPQTVALGTTVRHAVQRFADPAPSQLVTMATQGSGPNVPPMMSRWMQSNDPVQQRGPQGGAYQLGTVDFTGADQAVGPCGDGFDLPLLKGDVLSFGATSAGGRQ